MDKGDDTGSMGDELQFISTVSSALFLSLCEGVGVFREEVLIGWFEKGLFVKEELSEGPNSVKKSIKANKKSILLAGDFSHRGGGLSISIGASPPRSFSLSRSSLLRSIILFSIGGSF